jgi:N-acyl-D-aspartate/D-glutamate deacylase
METCDLVIRDGQIFDGSGGDPIEGGLAIERGRIVATGDVRRVHMPSANSPKGL